MRYEKYSYMFEYFKVCVNNKLKETFIVFFVCKFLIKCKYLKWILNMNTV